ncbi:hypothetical protein [Pseudomonas sp. NPDC089569]|uniref:hypothetical protein n=1 Tax=Pseudomonas sp. NPDC089569 TaxID=3390722 RepID=UPI003D022B26
MQIEAPQATLDLITRLKQLHPELHWGTYPLCDYDQCAELDAPDVLVTFSDDVDGDPIPDPFSNYQGYECVPSQWGVTLEAAELMRAHNKVFVAKYPKFDGPRSKA